MARKERKYHYIYKITCLKNNRYYIGMHSTDNLEDGYMGGGKRIKNSVKKHGKDAHMKEILEFFEDRESLRQREIQIINEDLLNDPLCMNLQPGGGGGFIDEDHKKKFREASIIGTRKKFKDPSHMDIHIQRFKKIVNRIWNDTNTREKIIKETRFTGKKHGEEAKKSIGEKNSLNQEGGRNSQFGTCWINKNMEYKKIKKELINDFLLNGWELGRSGYKSK